MSSGADRERARRQRQKAGLAVVPVVVPLAELEDALISAGLLKEWHESNRAKISEALSLVVRSWIERARVT